MKKNIKKKKIKVPAAQFGFKTPTLQDYYNDFQTRLKLGDTADMYTYKYGVNPNDERLYNFTLQAAKNTAGNIDKLSSISNSNIALPSLNSAPVAFNKRLSIDLDTAPNDPSNLIQKNSSGSGGDKMGSLNVLGIAQAIPGAINTLASPFQKSTATTGGEATMQSLSDIASGIGSGAQLGSAIGGPVGGAIGGAAGALIGAIGKKGKKAAMTSFTDYDEGTLNTGLRALFKGNKGLRAERARIRTNAFQNREGVAGTERLLNEFNENNTEIGTNTFQYGGGVPTSLAYVDDGELIQTPDGSVSKVPEQGQPTDSNLVDLPEGSRVLSNTLKVPGTSKTFAELGDKIMTKRKSKGNDIYAQNADMLNEMNNKMLHDTLFTMQENLKAKKGIKNKSKSIETYYNGGVSSRHNTINVQDNRYNLGDTFKYKGTTYKVTGTNKAEPVVARDTWGIKGDITAPWDSYGKTVDAGNLPEVTVTASKPRTTTPKVTTTATKRATRAASKSIAPEIVPDFTTIDEDYRVEATPNDIATRTTSKPIVAPVITKPTYNPDWLGMAGDVFGGLASLAPIMSNLFTSDPEAVPVNYNPYAQAIANTMARRKYNIDPVLRDIDTNRAVGDYSLSQQMTNTGHNMAFRLQNAIAANKAKLQARSVESNENNRYKAEYANAMNDLGRQYVNATNLASDLNAQNRATTRNIRRAGISQLSSWAQNRTLMRNQSKRDKAMLELYKPFLEAGFTTDVINNWNKFLR